MSFLMNRSVNLKSQHKHLKYTDEPLETADSPEPMPKSPQLWHHSEHERKQTEFYGHRCNVTDITEHRSGTEAQEDHRWADNMKHEIDSHVDISGTPSRSKASG